MGSWSPTANAKPMSVQSINVSVCRSACTADDDAANGSRRPRLLCALDRRDPSRQQQLASVEDLMMWLCTNDGIGRMAREHLGAGGRRLRACLALDTAALLGVSREAAVAWAAACELLHHATLVHDDLQDGDRVRRRQPTVGQRHGAAQAIAVGDLLMMLSCRALECCPVSDSARWWLCRALTGGAVRLGRGQSRGLSMLETRSFSPSDYERVALDKTGTLLGLPVAGALLLAGLDARPASRIVTPFERIGLPYQLQDDIRDLYGDEGRGRRGEDLREGKVSALVIAHLSLDPSSASWLVPMLEGPGSRVSDAMVSRVAEVFARSGALDRVTEQIERVRGEILGSPDLLETPELRPLLVAVLEQVCRPTRAGSS